MLILVATDIHGINDHLKALIKTLFQDLGRQIKFISPWETEGCPYQTEQEAVAAFHAQNGLAAYQQKIADAAANRPVFLLGFSVGASSTWLYVASGQCHSDSRAFLVYGSHIRHYLSLIPRCKTTLVFAQNEPSFQPDTITTQLINTQAECIIIKDTHHGFMNPLSPHFDEALTHQQLAHVKSNLMQIQFHPALSSKK